VHTSGPEHGEASALMEAMQTLDSELESFRRVWESENSRKFRVPWLQVGQDLQEDRNASSEQDDPSSTSFVNDTNRERLANLNWDAIAQSFRVDKVS